MLFVNRPGCIGFTAMKLSLRNGIGPDLVDQWDHLDHWDCVGRSAEYIREKIRK